MSGKTNIEWATSTGNPWIGCTKVSPGCKNCYAAELDANRFSKTMGGGTKENPVSHWGKGAPRVRTKAFWTDALKWQREAEKFPMKCPACGTIYGGRLESANEFIREKIDWVIVGGESGKDRRDCGVEAICDVARQCVTAGVPVFVKQDCAFKSGQQGRIPDEVWALKQFPNL